MLHSSVVNFGQAADIFNAVNPLITGGANIFLAYKQAELQKDLLKQQQNIPLPVTYASPGMSQQTIILLAVGVGAVLILLVALSNRGSSSSESSGTAVGSSGGKIIKKIVRRRPTS